MLISATNFSGFANLPLSISLFMTCKFSLPNDMAHGLERLTVKPLMIAREWRQRINRNRVCNDA